MHADLRRGKQQLRTLARLDPSAPIRPQRSSNLCASGAFLHGHQAQPVLALGVLRVTMRGVAEALQGHREGAHLLDARHEVVDEDREDVRLETGADCHRRAETYREEVAPSDQFPTERDDRCVADAEDPWQDVQREVRQLRAQLDHCPDDDFLCEGLPPFDWQARVSEPQVPLQIGDRVQCASQIKLFHEGFHHVGYGVVVRGNETFLPSPQSRVRPIEARNGRGRVCMVWHLAVRQ
mmetsp:Transcript_43008/g.118937  ORF Transcript_43008/g.118937 Transcript_43008/m.118937 type:complete len:237 (+) Transcript_43008:1892-2602(+)